MSFLIRANVVESDRTDPDQQSDDVDKDPGSAVGEVSVSTLDEGQGELMTSGDTGGRHAPQQDDPGSPCHIRIIGAALRRVDTDELFPLAGGRWVDDESTEGLGIAIATA